MKLIVVIDYLFKGHLRIKSDEDHYNCTEEQPLYLKCNIYMYMSYTLTVAAPGLGIWGAFEGQHAFWGGAR